MSRKDMWEVAQEEHLGAQTQEAGTEEMTGARDGGGQDRRARRAAAGPPASTNS